MLANIPFRLPFYNGQRQFYVDATTGSVYCFLSHLVPDTVTEQEAIFAFAFLEKQASEEFGFHLYVSEVSDVRIVETEDMATLTTFFPPMQPNDYLS